MWTTQSAEVFVASLNDALQAMRMTATIVGSVATKGTSSKDLDIVLQPLPGVLMTTECGLEAIYTHLIPLMVDGEKPEPLESSDPVPAWFINAGTRDGRTVEFYLPESSFPNVHPEELGLSKP